MIRTLLSATVFTAAVAYAAVAQQASVSVSEVWARATPPGAKTGAAYLTVANQGALPDRLVKASTPVASEAQLHTMIDDNGVMKMRPVAGIDVKAGGSVTLKPGGFHVMLMGLKQPLVEGESFPLTLTFEKAGAVATTVKVAKAGAASPGGGSQMHNMPGMDGMGAK